MDFCGLSRQCPVKNAIEKKAVRPNVSLVLISHSGRNSGLLAFTESFVVSGKLPTYLSPNLTLALTSFFGQNVRFGEG